MNIAFILISIFGFFSALFLTKWLISFLSKKGILDVPNQRSSHGKPVPRGGGIAIVSGFLMSLLAAGLLFPHTPLPGYSFFFGVVGLMIIGIIDDKISLSPILRFAVHFFAVGLVVYETGGFTDFPLPEPFSFQLAWAAVPLTFFWILAVMNIYNFLDGIDGFAGAQAVIAGLSFAILDRGGTGTIIGLAIAASSLGFLIFNWHPAKIFMGDVGSVTLGFIFATLPLFLDTVYLNIGNFAAVIFLWFFLSDGAFTIFKRLFHRRKIWKAHREHLYQCLVIKGKRHDLIVLQVMFYTAALIVSFLTLYFFAFSWLILSFILALLMFLVYLYRVNKYEPKESNDKL